MTKKVETSFAKFSGIDPTVTVDLNTSIEESKERVEQAQELSDAIDSQLAVVEQKIVIAQNTSSQIVADAANALAATTSAIDDRENTAITNILQTATTAAASAASNASSGVTNTANQAIETINSTKTSAVTQINTAAESAIESVSNSSASVVAATNEGIASINSTRDAAIGTINDAATTATTKAGEAAASATAANTAKTDAQTARTAAQTAATNAGTSATNAGNSATTASGAATTATQKAGEATTAAETAATKASEASGSATAAANSATAAANSAASINPSSFLSSSGGTVSGNIIANRYGLDTTAGFSLQSGTTPILAFDSNDYLHYDRTANQMAVVVDGTGRLRVNAERVEATVPVYLPATQSTNTNAAVHKAYVDNAFLLKNGGQMWGSIVMNSTTTPFITLNRAGNSNIGILFSNASYSKHFGLNPDGELCIASGADIGGTGSIIPVIGKGHSWTAAQDFASETSISNSSGDTNLKFNGPKANTVSLKFSKDWANRWTVSANNTTENGNNNGSDLSIMRFADDGSYLGTALQITRSNGDIFCGNVTSSGKLTAPTLSVDANFYAAIPSTNPNIFFDANDYLSYSRTSNQYSFITANSTRFSITGSSCTASVPVFLPSTQSTNANAAVHKTYVDGIVATANSNADARVGKAGDTMSGDLAITKTTPRLSLTYPTVRSWGMDVDVSGNFVVRDLGNATPYLVVNTDSVASGYWFLSRTSGGKLAMNTAHSAEFHWNNGFYYRVDGNTWVLINSAASDEKLKTNIVDESGALETIKQLRPRTYEFRDNLPISVPTGKRHGFIAQELEQVVPGISQESGMPGSEEQFLSLSQDAPIQLSALLTSAVQELSSKLDAALNRISALEAQLGSE